MRKTSSEIPQSSVSFLSRIAVRDKLRQESIQDNRVKSGSENDKENKAPRLRLVRLVKKMEESRAIPRSFSQALQSLKPHEAEAVPNFEQDASGIESVQGMEKLGLEATDLQGLMACLPGKSLGRVAFVEKVELVPDPTREGKKVFSTSKRNSQGKIDLNFYSPDHYGGDERARGLFIDEFSTELLRAYAKANRPENSDLEKTWESLISLAVHAPVSEDLTWAESCRLSLMAVYGVSKEKADQLVRVLADFFGHDPNEFVPAFQNKEKSIKRAMRMHELSQTVANAISNTPALSIITRGLDNPGALFAFAWALKQRTTDFHIENERSILARCAELAMGAAAARKEAEQDGDNFPQAIEKVGANARMLGNEWGKLESKRTEISEVLVRAWHRAMSENK